MADSREHDIVVFGATGFTGELTAQYLAKNAPADTRWALAGRNQAKLAAVRDKLGVDVPLLHADAADRKSLDEVAASTRVVITTVGPYLRYGEQIVAACAAAGTDYVDLTGEPEFVDLMYLRYHRQAEESGARIVHACGFDSIPHDLGAYFTVKQLPEDVPLKVKGYVQAKGNFSGGTFHSAVNQFSRARSLIRTAKERVRAEQRPAGRRVHGLKDGPHRVPGVGKWALPMPTIDPQIVLRSAAALERYGPDFSYGHFVVVPNLPAAAGITAGVAGVFALAQIAPTRNWLLGRVPQGSGPSPEKRDSAWFKVRFVGEGGGERVVTEVAGGDPGYSETAKMLAESALCLANDDLPETAGQVTTMQAMGDALIERLENAGITFSALEQPRSPAAV
jgi:saccharopine dehydrogenase (NAD+, L-glutamate forming)